jgi:hypothetical protein
MAGSSPAGLAALWAAMEFGHFLIHPEGIMSCSPGLRVCALPWEAGPHTRQLNPARVVSAAVSVHAGAHAPVVAEVLIHVVFSTKERRPLLRDTVLRSELHCYIGGILGSFSSATK